MRVLTWVCLVLMITLSFVAAYLTDSNQQVAGQGAKSAPSSTNSSMDQAIQGMKSGK